MASRAITKKGSETRRRIIEAAAKLIHTNGVAATSIDEILAEAGAGKSQFYHYFENKCDLVRAVLNFFVDGIFSALGEHLSNLDSFAGIENLFNEETRMMKLAKFCGGCPIGSLALEVAENDELVRMDIELYFDRFRNAVAKGLTAMKHDGVLSDEMNVQEVAEFIVAVIQGMMMIATVRKSAEPMQAARSQVMRLLNCYAR